MLTLSLTSVRCLMAESSFTFTFLLLLLARELSSSTTTRLCCSIISWTVWTSLLAGEGAVMFSPQFPHWSIPSVTSSPLFPL